MFRSAIAMTAAVFLAAAWVPVRAQDEEKVVPAHEEPRHVPKLVNEWVRIVDVEIPEGEQTMYHRHSIDYPYIFVTSVTLENQIYGKEPKDQQMQSGQVGYYDIAKQGAYVHRFINRGPGPFRAIGIELMKPPGGATNAALPAQQGAQIALDNNRVGAYRIKLPPGTAIRLKLPGPSIRVAMGTGRVADRIEGASESTTDLAPAQFHFRDAPVTTTVSNIGNQEVELVEFVLK